MPPLGIGLVRWLNVENIQLAVVERQRESLSETIESGSLLVAVVMVSFNGENNGKFKRFRNGFNRKNL